MSQPSEVASRWSSVSASPAVIRAATILDVLSAALGAPRSVAQIAAAAGVPRSSVANICAALCLAGMTIESDKGFLLGPRLLELGQAYLAGLDPLRNFTEACHALPEKMNETVQLATLSGLEVVYVARHDGNRRIQIASRVGLSLPANCTALGKAMLAKIDEDVISTQLRAAEPLPGLTSSSKTTFSELKPEFDRIRRLGYAIDDEETTEGILCVGVAVPHVAGNGGQLGVSVTTLKSLATPGRIDELVQTLMGIAEAVAGPVGDNALRRLRSLQRRGSD